MRLLIAGATGMAGSGLIEELVRTRPDIRLRGTYNSTKPFLHTDVVEYVQADLTRLEDCRRAAAGCDAALLVAAVTGGAAQARSNPAVSVTANIVMDALLLQALHEAGVRRAVYVSSATVYQEFDGAIAEDGLDLNSDPHGAYFGVGWAKRSAEKLCQFWNEKYGMQILVARAANIYGPYAAFHPDRSNFIPALIRKAVDRMDPFEVWGSGDIVRDVIYYTDFAQAVLALLHSTATSGVFNLGTGAVVTVADVVREALRAAGHVPSSIDYVGEKPQGIARRMLDCGKIQRATGWRPRVGLADGMALTTQWWTSNKGTWLK
jgi:Nucleoside-diphosphate-sugar epimerases